MPFSKKKKTTAVTTVTVLGVATRLLAFLFKIYLSRTLGAETLGVYQIALSVFFLFASVTASGIPLVLSRKIAEEQALRTKNGSSVFTTALLLSLLVSLLEIGVLFFLQDKIGFLFSDKKALPIFGIMIPALLSTSIYAVVRGWFWGKKIFSVYSVTETVEEILRILFSVLFLSGLIFRCSGEEAISYAFTLCDMIIALLLVLLFFKNGGSFSKPAPLKDILIPSLPLTAMHLSSGLFGMLLTLILPAKLLLYGMSACEATASIGRISGMANPLLFAPNAITGSIAVVMIPDTSGYYAQKDFIALRKRLNSGVHFSLWITGLCMAYFLACGQTLTSFLYSDIESGSYLQIAAFFMLPMCLGQISQSVLNAIGKEKTTFFGYLIGNLFMLLCVYFVTPYLGIFSVALGHFLSLSFMSLYNMRALHKYTGWGKQTARYFTAIFLFSCLTGIFTRSFLTYLSALPKILTLLLSACLCVFTYTLLTFVTGQFDCSIFFSSTPSFLKKLQEKSRSFPKKKTVKKT